MTAEHVIITGRADSRQGNAEEHHIGAPQFHQHTGQKAAESDSEVERNKESGIGSPSALRWNGMNSHGLQRGLHGTETHTQQQGRKQKTV